MRRVDKYLIINGTIINADSITKADVAVSGDKIKSVGKLVPADFPGYETIDATGRYLIPGGIDPHVHLALPTPAGNSSDDFVSGSLAALSGGTTAIIDFVTPKRGQSLIEALTLRRAEARASRCNWKLHLGISEWNEKVAEEVRFCIRHESIRSFKAYLAYRDTIGINYDELEQLMQLVGPEGGTVLVHCEEGEMISRLQQQYISEGKTNASFHALSRPKDAEINAIKTVISLSECTGCPVYIVHVSTGAGARAIREAKEKGLKVYGETCIQYLVLNDSVYDPSLPNEKVLPFVISPPIRPETERQQLWEELVKGAFDVVSTDHCPFNLHGQKDAGINDFTKIPNGAGGVEFRLSLLYSYGVATHKISLQQFVSLTSARAAEIFGWSETKGKIAKGYDADIVIWNPETNCKISTEKQLQHCDSNIYEGIEVNGKAEKVFNSGKCY
jgi:dihydropyrimidinase